MRIIIVVLLTFIIACKTKKYIIHTNGSAIGKMILDKQIAKAISDTLSYEYLSRLKIKKWIKINILISEDTIFVKTTPLGPFFNQFFLIVNLDSDLKIKAIYENVIIH